MTTKELETKVTIQVTSMHGHYKVTITYRGVKYTCITTNAMAYDAIMWPDSNSEYTYRQALQVLYDECKRANNL